MKKEKAIRDIIDKMFEIAGYKLGFDDMIGRDDEWYSKYTMTTAQNDEWMLWGSEYLYKNKIVHSKRMAKNEMAWMNLSFGLKIDNNDNTGS